MIEQQCPREDELLDALARGFVAPELDEHATSCLSCSELRVVAGALLDDKAVAIAEAPVPSAGTMWWRLRVRHRHEAVERARRSLLIGQAMTLAIAITLVASFFGRDVASALRDLFATIRLSTPLLLALATWVLIAPIAGWVAIRQK
jgi:hypothetical protein